MICITTGNVGSNSGRKTLCVMYNSVSLSALTAPVIIGPTLLIAVFLCAIIKRTIIARLCSQLLIFIITLCKCY